MRDYLALQGARLDRNIHDDRIVIRKRHAVMFEVAKRLSLDAGNAALFVDDLSRLDRSHAVRREPIETKLEQQPLGADSPVYPPLHRAWQSGRIIQARNNCPAGRASIVERPGL